MTKRLLEYLTWLIIGASLLVSAYLGGMYYFQVFSIQEGFTTALAHSHNKNNDQTISPVSCCGLLFIEPNQYILVIDQLDYFADERPALTFRVQNTTIQDCRKIAGRNGLYIADMWLPELCRTNQHSELPALAIKGPLPGEI